MYSATYADGLTPDPEPDLLKCEAGGKMFFKVASENVRQTLARLSRFWSGRA